MDASERAELGAAQGTSEGEPPERPGMHREAVGSVGAGRRDVLEADASVPFVHERVEPFQRRGLASAAVREVLGVASDVEDVVAADRDVLGAELACVQQGQPDRLAFREGAVRLGWGWPGERVGHPAEGPGESERVVEGVVASVRVRQQFAPKNVGGEKGRPILRSELQSTGQSPEGQRDAGPLETGPSSGTCTRLPYPSVVA